MSRISFYTVISWDDDGDDDDDDIVIEWYCYEDGVKQFRDIIYWMGTTLTHTLACMHTQCVLMLKNKRFQRGVCNGD